MTNVVEVAGQAKVVSWQCHIGNESYYDCKCVLTRQMLTEWAEQDNPELTCIFCGSIWSLGVKICPRCNEYKGLVPAIDGWSM